MSSRILNWIRLQKEYEQWFENYGEGRDLNDLRFGQYLYIKYDLSEFNVDPFYPEGCENVFAMLSRDMHDRFIENNVRKEKQLCQRCNKKLINLGERCFCRTIDNRNK